MQTFPDHVFWKKLYIKEHGSLNNQHTYNMINRAHYLDKFSHIAIIPTMCAQTIKIDEIGDPDRVKSQIVALGNHKDDIWTKSQRYAPVIEKGQPQTSY